MIFLILSFGIFLFLGGLYFLIRNQLVFRELQRVIFLVYELGKKDIRHHKDPGWRWDSFNEISYFEVVFKFWKPVKSFYKNHKCLSERED